MWQASTPSLPAPVTPEDGFEVYCKAEEGIALFEAIMEAGEGDGLVPAGLGCRDTLRFEASMPLYGQELDENHGPLVPASGRFVAFGKDLFRRPSALMEQRERDFLRNSRNRCSKEASPGPATRSLMSREKGDRLHNHRLLCSYPRQVLGHGICAGWGLSAVGTS